MVTLKRKKNIRMRGTKSHGYGAKKKHRGAGHRGGRGLAGSGKRSDTNKPSIWSNKKYFGKFGFTSKKKVLVGREINIKDLEDTIPTLVSLKLIEEKAGVYIIDLTKLGYTKLLSTGTPSKKLEITTFTASEKAIEKVKKQGGSVKILINGSSKSDKEESPK